MRVVSDGNLEVDNNCFSFTQLTTTFIFYQIYISFFFYEQNDCTQSKCGELSEYTGSAHTEVEDPSSRCMNGSDE